MSKQDRQGARTAADLERKYGFGQSFAEVYGLIDDVQQTAEEAKNAAADLDESLTAEEIFTRLTGGSVEHGVYRGPDGKLYVNANFIKSGKVKAENIDTDNLTVKAANVTGKLSASQIDAQIMQVGSGNIYDLTSSFVRIMDLLSVYGIATDGNGNPQYDAEGNVKHSLDGHIGALLGHGDGQIYRGAALLDGTANNYFIATTGGARMSAGGVVNIYTYYDPYTGGGGAGSTHTIVVASDKRLKNSIVYGLEDYEELFKKLRPCSFALNSDKNGLRHWGLIAQDVQQNIEDSELSDPIALVANTGGHYGIAYGEITSLNTHMIQKLMSRVEELEKKVAELGGETKG